MKDIKEELREFVDPADSEVLDRLWKHFVQCADACRMSCGGQPLTKYVHPPEHARRAENLRSALHDMHAEDWRVLHSLCTLPAPVGCADNGDGLGITHDAFSKLMSRLETASADLRDFNFNAPHRPASWDLPMHYAVRLWRDHVGRAIGTNEEGPFARFARLFFRAIDPSWVHRTDSLQRRIRAAREDDVELDGDHVFLEAIPLPPTSHTEGDERAGQ